MQKPFLLHVAPRTHATSRARKFRSETAPPQPRHGRPARGLRGRRRGPRIFIQQCPEHARRTLPALRRPRVRLVLRGAGVVRRHAGGAQIVAGRVGYIQSSPETRPSTAMHRTRAPSPPFSAPSKSNPTNASGAPCMTQPRPPGMCAWKTLRPSNSLIAPDRLSRRLSAARVSSDPLECPGVSPRAPGPV